MTDLLKGKHWYDKKSKDKGNEYEREKERERERERKREIKWVEYSYINPFSYN